MLILLSFVFGLQRFHGHHELVITALVVMINAVSIWLVDLQHVQVVVPGNSCKLLLTLTLLPRLLVADSWVDELGACLSVRQEMLFRGLFMRVG